MESKDELGLIFSETFVYYPRQIKTISHYSEQLSFVFNFPFIYYKQSSRIFTLAIDFP